MPFAKGQSGNPAGRPRGVATKQTKLRAEIAKHVPGIVTKTVELAMAGDTTAIKILLDRVLPALKPTELPVAVAQGDALPRPGKPFWMRWARLASRPTRRPRSCR